MSEDERCCGISSVIHSPTHEEECDVETNIAQNRPALPQRFPTGKDGFAHVILRVCRSRWFILCNLLIVAALSAWAGKRWGLGQQPLQLLTGFLAVEGFVISLSLLWASTESIGKAGGARMEPESKVSQAKVPSQILSSTQVAGDSISVATCSVLGHRKQNEDASGAYTFPLADSEATLLIVCDGVGGEASGDRASKEAIKLFSKLIPEIIGLGETVKDVDAFSNIVNEHFKEMVRIFGEIAERESLTGLTTTVVAALAYKDFLAYWWAGDSRAYLLRKGRLRLLSKDHSVPVERYHIDPHEVANHEEKSTITRALQPNAPTLPDIKFETLEKGDVLVLCSDGVWESCTYGELQGVINYYLAADLPLNLICQNVLNALAINTSDNSTIAMHRQNEPASSHTLLHPGVLQTKGLREELLAWFYETNGEKPLENIEHLVKAHSSSPETITESYANSQGAARRKPLEGEQGEANAQSRNNNEGARLCMHCARLVTSETACCDEPDLHAGFYLHMTDGKGKISYHKISNPKATILGRLAGSEGIEIDDPLIAPRHLKIEVEKGGEILFKDLDSDNGTFLSISSHRALLADLDSTVLQLGASRIQLLHTSSLGNGIESGQPS
jgi:serine/threonine protein phosphatase PrpC